MKFLTSDCHFGHSNILKYCPVTRPFNSIEEHDLMLIQNWNSVVSENDEVWVVGDFILGDPTNVKPIISQLNGKIHLVRGNHDSQAKIEIYESLGIDVKDIDYIEYKNIFFILCHFPIGSEDFCTMLSRHNPNTIFCYGHVHDQAPAGLVSNTFHVGVDTNALTPVSLDSIAWEYYHGSAF